MAIFFDSLMRLWLLISKPAVLDWIDSLEAFIQALPDCSITVHRYGGSQFNYQGKEFAHLHSHGLLDILFNQQIKKSLIAEGKALPHHVFPQSGWISFYIRTEADLVKALDLLQQAYERIKAKHS